MTRTIAVIVAPVLAAAPLMLSGWEHLNGRDGTSLFRLGLLTLIAWGAGVFFGRSLRGGER